MTASDCVDLVHTPSGPVALTRSGSVFASLDGGATFSLVGASIAADHVALNRAGSGSGLLALTRTGLLVESGDAGVTWIPIGSITAFDLVALAGDDTGTLHALTSSGTIHGSDDAGATWPAVGTISQVGMTDLEVASGGTLLACGSTGEVYASDDDGASWNVVGATGQLYTVALGTDRPLLATSDPGPSVPATPRAWPNPARAGTPVLHVDVRGAGSAEPMTLTLHDVTGRLCRAGTVVIGKGGIARWDVGPGLPPGVYVVSMLHESGRSIPTRWVLVP